MIDSTPAAAGTSTGRSHLHQIFNLLSKLGGKTSPAETIEEDAFRVREGFHRFKLEQVESEPPGIDFSTAGRPEHVNLVYFARMMQRTQLVGHFINKGREVPVHYALTGAILLKRENRKFHVWGDPELRANVILPFKYVNDPAVLEDFKHSKEFYLVDSGSGRAEYTQHRIAAVRKAREITMDMRARMYAAWREREGADDSKFIVISGMVADVPNEKFSSNFVATARRVYVPWQNAELLEPHLLTPAYYRSALMRSINTEGGDPMPKYTWFLRMRSSSQADPEFGLLRCTCVADNTKQAIQRANDISARLLDERLPVTFPAEQWDRLIFPLKLCREYLDSLVPSRDTVKSYFARS